MTEAYQWHACFLQHLQADFHNERWVLKTPPHLAYLKYLLAQYPDAALVWTHRKPLDAIASFASLVSTLQSGFSDEINPKSIGQHEATHFARMLNRGIEQRNELDMGQFFDVSFNEICSNPLGVVSNIYDYFGFGFSQEAEFRMTQYLKKRPRGLNGQHKYDAKDFGLGGQDFDALFSDYGKLYGDYFV